jgi:hypothetical protein
MLDYQLIRVLDSLETSNNGHLTAFQRMDAVDTAGTLRMPIVLETVKNIRVQHVQQSEEHIDLHHAHILLTGFVLRVKVHFIALEMEKGTHVHPRAQQESINKLIALHLQTSNALTARPIFSVWVEIKTPLHAQSVAKIA